MRNAIVSKGLYIEGLRKIRIPAIIFTALVFLSEGILPFAHALFSRGFGYKYTKEVVTALNIIAPLAIIAVIAVPILTLAAFFAFNKRSSSDFYQSLPYTRECLFFSWILSVLTVACGITVFGFALGCLSYSIVGMFIVNLAGIGRILLYYFAAMLFAMACVLIAMSVTGTFIANVVCTLLLMFLPRIILILIRGLVLNITPVLSEEHFLRLFSIDYNAFFIFCAIAVLGVAGSIFGGDISDIMGTAGVGPAVVTLVIGVAYIVIAALLFKIRKSETATLSGSNRVVQHIIRIALTFAVSLLGTYVLFEEEMRVLGVAIYFIALIVFFAYEIITTRKWINLVKIIPTLLIVIALNAAVWGFAHICSNVIRNSDVSADSISSVRIYGLGDSEFYYSSRIAEIDIEASGAKQIVADSLSEDLKSLREDRYYEHYFNTHYQVNTVAINSGSGTIYRNIRFTDADMQELGKALASENAFREAIISLPDEIAQSVTITMNAMFGSEGFGVSNSGVLNRNDGFSEEEAAELVSITREEIRGLDYSGWYEYINDLDKVMGSYFVLSYTDNSPSHIAVSVPISQKLTPRAFEAAQRLFVKCQNKDGIEYLMGHLDEIQKEGLWYYMNVMVCHRDQTGEEEYDYLDMDSGSVEHLSVLDSEEYISMLKDSVNSLAEPTAESWLLLCYDFDFDSGSESFPQDFSSNGTVILPVSEKYVKMLEERTQDQEF